MVSMEFQTAADALETRKNILHLTTGSIEIDKLLEGGIETGSITEVVSSYESMPKLSLFSKSSVFAIAKALVAFFSSMTCTFVIL